MSKLFRSETRITYYDLDCRGNIKLSALLRMVHIAADMNANELGLGYQSLSAENMSFILQRFGLNIVRMPIYNESVTVRTWPSNISRGTFIRQGDMYDTAGQKIMEWSSLWLLFDVTARKILKPSALPTPISSVPDQKVTVKPNKIDLPNNFGVPFYNYSYVVRYVDVDTNMHMNNSIYGDLIDNALFPSVETENLTDRKHVQINYLSETRLGEKMDVSARCENDTFLVIGEVAGRTTFMARVN